MLRYCDRLIADSAENDEKQIIQILKAILDGKLSNDLTLQNFYEDVPVSFKADINLVADHAVELTAHKLQTLVMGMGQGTLIRSAHLPHPVLAMVQRVDDQTHIAKLVNFGFATVPADNRRHVWVHLTDRFAARFSNRKYTLTGIIRDISLGGVAVLSQEFHTMRPGAVGIILLDLGEARAEIPGTLLKVTRQGAFKKYIFKLDRGSRSEQTLSRFITRRQSEIIRDLMEQT